LHVPGFEASTVNAGPAKCAKTGFAGADGVIAAVVEVAVAVAIEVGVPVAVGIAATLALGAADAVALADGVGAAATVADGAGVGSGFASSWHAVSATPRRTKWRRLTAAMIPRLSKEALSALSTASP
jgi:hypothetical protein